MQKTSVAVLVDTAHVAHPDRIALEGAPTLTSGQLTLDRSTLEKLRDHAAFAAHLVGHLDANPPPELVRQLGDRIDAIALAEVDADVEAADGPPRRLIIDTAADDDPPKIRAILFKVGEKPLVIEFAADRSPCRS